MTQILVVEPHPLTRQGLVAMLDAEPDLHVCADTCCAAPALEALARHTPDLAVLTIELAGMTGLDLAQQMLQQQPGLRVLILSLNEEALCAERALRAGAHGFLSKQEPAAVVLQAVRHVLAGGYFVSPKLLDGLLEAIARTAQPVIPSPADVLSEREMELFELMGQGLGTHEIADRMQLSMKTVESYRNRIKHKLNLTGTADLVRQAVMWQSEAHICYSWTGCDAVQLDHDPELEAS